MKKLILLVILAFSMVLSPLATTFAATPKVINYQGQLESDAITSKAPVLVVFELFEDAAGGSALWIEQKSVTVDKNGFFSVYLGDVNPIDLKFDKQYFVQVTVGNNQPFPRTKLSSTPSAFYAADADTATYAFTAGLALKVAPKAIDLSNLADEVLTAGGDLMGMYPNPQIKPSAIIDNIPDGSITSEMLSPNISTSPSGPAGGDLFGVYPDPLIAVGAVKTDRIFDAAVTNVKIADGAVTNNKIVSLDAAKLTNVPALNYQVAVATDATIDGDGTLAMPLGLADNAVSTSKIVDGAVTNAKVGANAITTDKILNETILAEDIAAGAVTTSEILDETILAADIATGAVTTSEILNETILAEDIATGAVTTSEILDETILATDIATGAVTTSEILNSTILTEDLSDNAVTQAKLADDAVRVRNIDVSGAAPANGDVLYFDGGIGEMRWGQENVQTSAPLTGNGTTLAPVTLDPAFGSADELLIRTAPSGWVSSKINTNNINDGAVTTAKLANNSVTSAKIVDGEVMNADLANNSVTTAKILDGEVMTADLATNSVTTVKITDANVTTAKLADGSVTTSKINDDAVTNIKIDDDAITGNKVLNGSLSSLDLNTTGVVSGIYGDPSAVPSTIDVPEYKVDAQGRILESKENSYTVLGAGTIFNESAASDISVDGPYNALDLQILPGKVGTTELANDAVISSKIADGTIITADLADNSITSAKIIDGTVTSADIADGTIANIDLAANSVMTGNIVDGTIALADMGLNSVGTTNIIDNNVLNTKIGSGAQVAGKVLKADGAGNTVWGDDLGLTLPYTGSYDGPGDAFTITHTGAAGSGSAAVFTSSTATNVDPTVEITKDVAAGAGSALTVTGIGVTGTNYIAKMTNTNGAEGRTLLLTSNSPVLAAQITDPNGVPNSGDEYVTPDPTGTDLNDATLVVRNNNAAVSNQKLAIKTYGSIQANSTIQGTNLVAHGGQITLLNPTTGAVATLMPPTNPGDPLNVTPALNINGTSTVLGINNIWESFDGNLFPAGTGTDRDVPTALAVSNSIGAIAGEPFITFAPDGGGLTNNRVFAVNSTLTKTIAGADNGNIDLSINLANPNTWTGTQTLSAAGNGLVVTTNTDLQGTIANSIGSVTVADAFVVNGTSTLNGQTAITTAGTNALQVNNNAAAPTATFTNGGAGSSIDATGKVMVNAGGLEVTGLTDLNTGLNVDGASTLDNVTIVGTLSQSAGQVTLAGNVDATAGLDVTGATTLAGTVSQTGGGQVTISGNVDANGGLDVVGAATVAGTVTQTGAGNQVSFAGNVDAANGLDVTGGMFSLPVSGAGVDVNEVVTSVGAAPVRTHDQLPTALAVQSAIGAVAAEPFLTFAADGGTLTNNRVFAVSTNLTNTIGGADNSNATLDLSNTTVVAAAYGNNTGTSYSTFTVDAKGRLTAAATQAVVVDDVVASDISISGAASNVLDLQIDADVVTSVELANDNYDTELLAGNYILGNLDATIIGAATPAAGTFTNLVAQTDYTLGGVTVDDIYVTADGVSPITGDDTDLITAGAVAAALALQDLQQAYVNGNTITTSALEGDVVISGTENLDINIATDISAALTTTTVTASGLVTANAGATVTGATTLNGNTSVTGANTFTVGTGATTLGGTTTSTGLVTANGGLTVVGTVTLDNDEIGDAEVVNALTIDGGTVNNSVIGGTGAAAGTFTALNATTATTTGLVTAGNGLTVSAGNFTLGGLGVDGIQNTIPLAADATDLVTENAVFLALAAHDLQVAYDNGNTITTAGGLDVVIAGTEQLDVRTSIENTIGDVTVSDNLLVNGANTFTVGTGATTLGGTLAVTGATTATGLVTANGGATVNGATTLAGTVSQTGAGNQVTFAGNVDANNGLDVTGTTTLAGVVTQTGAGQVTFGGNIDASSGIDVVGGGINITTGALNVQAGGAVITGGAVINGGINVNGTANLNNAVNVLGTLNAVETIIAGGGASAINNTPIGGATPAAGAFTSLSTTGAFTAAGLITANGGLTVNGTSTLTGAVTQSAGQVTFAGNVDATNGLDVTGANLTVGTTTVDPANGNTNVGGTLTVVGTSDLRGVVSNTTGAVTVNDDVDFNLQAATDQVGIVSNTATGSILVVNNTNAANANYVASVSSTGTNGLTVSQTAVDGIALNVSAGAGLSTGAVVASAGASATAAEGAALFLENTNAATDGTAKGLEIAQGSVVLSTVPAAVSAANTATQGQYTVVELNAIAAGTFPPNAPVGTIIIYVNTTGAAMTVGGTLGINAGEAIMAVKSTNGNWYKIGG